MHTVKTITVNSGSHEGHVQGIAFDNAKKYMYVSATTRLLKVDMQGNVIGSVKGLVGHLGCIAYNPSDNKVYGSLEFKHDSIGRGILERVGGDWDVQDGFYLVRFDVDKINRMDMDAEKDGVMTAWYLKEVYDDYANHNRYGCSGIDGVTFAPDCGVEDQKLYAYVAYGVYGDTNRTDNDYQVLLQYDTENWDVLAKPLDQTAMHHSGPATPRRKYFVYTGNTTFGIQNLEYDPHSDTILAAVYRGQKPQFPNFPLFFIDRKTAATHRPLIGLSQEGEVLHLADIGEQHRTSGLKGSRFPYGATGLYALGDGYFYVSQDFETAQGFGTTVRLYKMEADSTFAQV